MRQISENHPDELNHHDFPLKPGVLRGATGKWPDQKPRQTIMARVNLENSKRDFSAAMLLGVAASAQGLRLTTTAANDLGRWARRGRSAILETTQVTSLRYKISGRSISVPEIALYFAGGEN